MWTNLCRVRKWRWGRAERRGRGGTSRGRSSDLAQPRDDLPGRTDLPARHPFLLGMVQPEYGPRSRTKISARVFQRQEQEQDASDLQGLPGFHDQHVSTEPVRVLDGDGV